VSYLMTRNNMRYRRVVSGVVGVLDGLRYYARETIHNVRLMVDPRSSGPDRRFQYARLIGMWAGVGGFLLGRRGGPPAWLPGLGEMGRQPAGPRRRTG
jgi:hypothetical protein